jgi:peptidoglycan/xylan/chitin deacetylase (PgdA/CDA1 family)
MERCLDQYTRLAAEFGAPLTLPITASVLARHPTLIRRFVDRGVEFAVHGLFHDDHASLSLEQQQWRLARALGLFDAADVPCAGFRAPYLRANPATQEAVRSAGLRYDSTQAVAFPVLDGELTDQRSSAAWKRALDLYAALPADEVVVRPTSHRDLVDLPVALPDDEIMVDRLRLPPEAQTAVWLAILKRTYARGELFTVQLHPERIFACADALRALLTEVRATRPSVWVTHLSEIAAWWLQRGRMRLRVDQVGPDRYHVVLRGGPGATLLVRGLEGIETEAWVGRDRLARPQSFEVRSAVRPVVGVSRRCPEAVLKFLHQEGLPAEHSDEPGRYGTYLYHAAATTGLDQVRLLDQIERSPGPLVRLWRWPAGARSALAVTGDIDAITLQDFFLRPWEGRSRIPVPEPRPAAAGGLG